MRAWGWLKSPADKRDWFVYSVAEQFPEEYQCPDMDIIPVLDQGTRPSCVGHATATMKMWQEMRDRKIIEPMSREYIYTRCKMIDGIPMEGGTYPRVAMSILAKYGTCNEKLCPYKSVNNLIQITSVMDEGALINRIESYARVQTLSSMKQALMTCGPVVIGVPVYSNWSNHKHGLIPTPNGVIEGGHAICVYGWKADYFLFRNSWGKHWGQQGNGQLSVSYPGILDDAWFAVDKLSGMVLVKGFK